VGGLIAGSLIGGAIGYDDCYDGYSGYYGYSSCYYAY
jgi:hypothetical protein